MDKDKLIQLANAFILGTATEEEKQQLHQWYEQTEMSEDEEVEIGSHETQEQIGKRIFSIIQQKAGLKEQTKVVSIFKRTWFRIAAASVILLMSIGTYLVLNRTPGNTSIATGTAASYKNDVAPGKYKAMLTLANGQKIVLDSAGIGKLAQQGNTSVSNQNGQLIYNAQGNDQQEFFNTLSTARGEVYPLVLSDGSKVWLNSASSIRFPVAFTGKQRNVEITGEAYFEVAKDATKPFNVNIAGKGNVEVLGTHFNINAYDDEDAIKTTLLEGSVQVTLPSTSVADPDKFGGEGSGVRLKPGEQAQIPIRVIRDQKISVIQNINTDEVIAWKNGKFSFTAADIKTVMRQIARWYDVDVNFHGDVKEVFYVKMDRNTNVSNVFKILETTGAVHFKIDGKKITVLP